MLEEFKKKENYQEIAEDATLVISNWRILSPVEQSVLEGTYIRLMIGDESNEIIDNSPQSTRYIPIKNITNSLYFMFWQKKGTEVSYLDKMVGSLEVKLNEFLDQRKHRITNAVQLDLETSGAVKFDLGMDIRLWYSRTAFLTNIWFDIDELLNNETNFDEYLSKPGEQRNSITTFIQDKQKVFKGFLARKSLRDKNSELLMQEYMKYKVEDSEEEESDELTESD